MPKKKKPQPKSATIVNELSKQVGEHAAIILRKVDRMLKHGVPRASIEKALAKELSSQMRQQLDLFCQLNNVPVGNH